MSAPKKNVKVAGSRAHYVEQITRAFKRTHDQILWVGQLLIDAKADLKHGEFEAMIETDLPWLGKRVAEMFMAIKRDERLANAKLVSLLPPSYSTLYVLSGLDDDTFNTAIEDGRVHAGMTRQEAEKIRKQSRHRERLDHVERIAASSPPSLLQLQDLRGTETAVAETVTAEEAGGEVEIISPAPPPVARRYAVIHADPPWRFQFYGEEAKQSRGPGLHYPTMTPEEIAALPVGEVAARDCVLFLWVTVPCLAEAITKVLPAWGFTYKSHIVWRKPKIDTGYWTRVRHEVLIIATRGEPPCPLQGTQWESVLDAAPQEPGRHSSKPAEAREMIEAYFPGVRRLELFARAPEDGAATRGDDFWDFWGNQADPVFTFDASDEGEEINTVDVEADEDIGIRGYMSADEARQEGFDVDGAGAECDGAAEPDATVVRREPTAEHYAALDAAASANGWKPEGLAEYLMAAQVEMIRLGDLLPADHPQWENIRAELYQLTAAEGDAREYPDDEEAKHVLAEACEMLAYLRAREEASDDVGEAASEAEAVEEEEDLLEIPDFLRRT